MDAKVQAAKLAARGYRRTSRAHNMLARCDRPDWREAMAASHANGMDWVRTLERMKSAADQYRRCYSRDKITVSRTVALLVPCSDHDTTGYLP